jgi:hypothetical protein
MSMIWLSAAIDNFIYSWRAADERPAIRILVCQQQIRSLMFAHRGCCTSKKIEVPISTSRHEKIYYTVCTRMATGGGTPAQEVHLTVNTHLSWSLHSVAIDYSDQIIEMEDRRRQQLIVRHSKLNYWWQKLENKYIMTQNVICPDSPLPVGQCIQIRHWSELGSVPWHALIPEYYSSTKFEIAYDISISSMQL